jgi:hypothetical protein
MRCTLQNNISSYKHQHTEVSFVSSSPDGFLDPSRRVPTFRRHLPPSGHRYSSTLMTAQFSETSVNYTRLHDVTFQQALVTILRTLCLKKLSWCNIPRRNFYFPVITKLTARVSCHHFMLCVVFVGGRDGSG